MRSSATRANALDKLVAALQSGICDQAAARGPAPLVATKNIDGRFLAP